MTKQIIQDYLQEIDTLFNTGNATEHSYRGHLETLLNAVINDDSIQVINEPARIKNVGAPDYSISKNKAVLGYIEVKDIGDSDLEGKKENKEQFNRYKKALPNLIISDYLRFYIYQNGELIEKMTLANIEEGKIIANEQDFALFNNSIKNFTTFVSQSLTQPAQLAKLMAGKAKLLESIIHKSLLSDEHTQADDSLKDQYEAFKSNLIHDLSEQDFADVYAQTIAYGLFAARLHDENLETFSRQEAQYLIPKTNPFLRGLFNYISGAECDDRLVWIIDSLADIFKYTNVEEILYRDKKSQTISQDPVIHFYETFLSEYNPALRKSRGVWYTPQPVVNFIVRAVDELLKTEFNLSDGLLDESKVTLKIDDPQAGLSNKGKKVRQKEIQTHKVQILDPATGTGTFLAEAIKLMKEQYFGTSWSRYVENSLIPRVHGFELLMASYAMAHLKLDLLLKETDYQPIEGINQRRFSIYLTNALEEHHPDTGTLFAQYLANESREANRIKKETPVMVVMGNPPYSGESANKGDWIMQLMEDYKKEPGGKIKLQERNPKWINDDYVKFMRFAQYHIEKNGEGVLAFINPHGFLDNPTFRGMRWNLLKSFDKIYTIDLHGNSKKKETAPDGSVDENVFDIQQGVSINLLLKTGKKKAQELGQVYHYDLYGKREAKCDFLLSNHLNNIPFTELPNKAPMYFMVQKNFGLQEKYQRGFSLTDLFTINSVGIVTARDNFTIHQTNEEVKKTIDEFLTLDDEIARTRFKLGKDVRDWQVNFAKKDLQNNYPNKGHFIQINYRPFDTKWTYYTGNSKGFHCYPRNDTMKHFLQGDNVGLSLCKQFKTGNKYSHAFISNNIIESSYVSNRTSEITSTFPLYLYLDENDLEKKRTPNLNEKIVKEIEQKLGLTFTDEKEETKNTFAPIDLLDYIYAVLHSPTYREKYKEFLKIDFPRVPYPNIKTFWQLVKLGGQLRKIHLLEDQQLNNKTIDTQGQGSDVITNKLNKHDWLEKDGKVELKINDDITIINIPLVAWGFYIGGYQPAQKWLKDRVGTSLSMADFKHYNRIINALIKSDELMQKINKIKIN